MSIGYVHTLETPTGMSDKGSLKVSVTDRLTGRPVDNAVIDVSYTADPSSMIEELTTDSDGQTEEIILPAPPLEYSMEPGINQPYAEYTVTVRVSGFEPFSVSGVNVMSGEKSLQNAQIVASPVSEAPDNIVIPAHTLFGEYPPKIAESEIKQINRPGEIVLSRVVIPETIVVHDGPPSDNSATNYYVRYSDYIKNVACSEIYSTWPVETIEANVLAIMSFTLNRVYTEWYRNQGYDFTITSSTAYDHKWMNGRNMFKSISDVVDEVFNNYLSRPNVKQPILTQYCDGKRVSCPDWMSQWGSKYLGDQSYNSIEILRYYYGDDMYINSAEQISGIPSSWPGNNLDIGSSGQKVRQLQEQLNLIGEYYNRIPVLIPDGIYGERTADAVRQFQRIFDMPQTGVVDFATWYKISDKYVRLSEIAELV